MIETAGSPTLPLNASGLTMTIIYQSSTAVVFPEAKLPRPVWRHGRGFFYAHSVNRRVSSTSVIPALFRCLCEQPFEQVARSVEDRQSAWDRVETGLCGFRSAPNLKGRTGAAGWRYVDVRQGNGEVASQERLAQLTCRVSVLANSRK